jgi:hypothetical protein
MRIVHLFGRWLIATALAAGAAGCADMKLKPWVSPYERNNLADPIMSFNRDPIASSYLHHVYQAREGARGAEGGSGGGCGCN